MRWVDDDNLDLMHHVIIMNIPEAAEYLLSHGFFQVCIYNYRLSAVVFPNTVNIEPVWCFAIDFILYLICFKCLRHLLVYHCLRHR